MTGIIVWEGPSEIDGMPLVVVATGLKKSRNAKTGDIIQTWILRADVSPVEAVATGKDESICGACPHRGTMEGGKNVNRSCYVTVFQAPLSIWKTVHRGSYERPTLEETRAIFAGRSVRLGAYGDPAAVPFEVWESMLRDSGRGTGYTHQWKTCDSRFAQYCMASADSMEEGQEARAMGYRTFRVGTPAERIVKGQEFLCPASKEAGQKTNCAACLACGGTNSPNRASVFINAHGMTAKIQAFERRAGA